MNKIALPTSEGFIMVTIDQIVRCKADSNYTSVILANGQDIVVCRQLKVLENALPQNSFVRVHHSHLINLNYVASYKRNGGGRLLMTNGDQIEVSRSKKNDLMDKVNII